MNRNVYRLKFNNSLGAVVPVAETVRGCSKATSGSVLGTALGAALLLSGLLLSAPVQAELPVACGTCTGIGGVAIPDFVSSGLANYQIHGNQGLVHQVGDTSILNWQTFNVSSGHSVQFQQVDSLTTQNLVQGASFTSLNRIWDANPSVIAGIITQAGGQSANIILVNSNGIAFMGSSQVNLNSFTASSLNIADSFILNSFLTTSSTPQFEGSGGFIKVFEGARITAASQGRVMLLAPTVVNMGKVEAAEGQVIAAAGTRMFLSSASGKDSNVRGLLIEVDSPAGLASFDTANTGVKNGVLDGQTVALTDPALDKLGHVTNLGELSAARGNVTMIGYAVNQQGIARATTSVVANGSVYLLARDQSVNQVGNQNDNPLRGGRVVLGSGSLTKVLPDVLDSTTALDGSTGAGLALKSQVKVLGQDVRMESGALIDAPAGEVNLIAIDKPGLLATGADPFTNLIANSISPTARIHIAGSARINVAGLENVQVSVARNGVEVELRGDEFKDSPVNRDGLLRGQKVYVDINRALANANAGKSTLIAQDSLVSYQGRLERTVTERSTEGGSVSVRSQGETIIESGAVIDLSGGSMLYTPGIIKTTLLTSRGKLTDIADALAAVRYDGNSTRYVVDYKKWNVREVIELGQSFNFDPGYLDGKNAGALQVIGMSATFMQADVQGRTSVGALQRDGGIIPDGARLTFGSQDVTSDFKLNQRVELGSAAATLPAGFKFGDVLPAGLRATLNINPALLGKNKIADLEIFSNQTAEVLEALRAPQGGSVHIIAQKVAVNADIEAASGSISLHAKQNLVAAAPSSYDVSVAAGVTLSARGAWVNELPGVTAGSNAVALVDGGKITLSAADNLALGQNIVLDVSGGGRLKANGKGKVIAGNGGDISLSGISGVSGVNSNNLLGYSLTGAEGGTLTLASNRIQIGGTPAAGTLSLDVKFFERGGFANFSLSALENLTLAAGATVRPTVLNRELLTSYTVQPSGSRVEAYTQVVKLDDLLRQAANLSLAVHNTQAAGDLLIGTGARIAADPNAQIKLTASHLLDIQGSITAPGGSISATLHPDADAFNAGNSIWLGRQATLDVSGVALTYTDSKRLTQGTVLAGGNVTLNAEFGYIVTEAGSSIKIAGAAPVRLDIYNEAGGLGRLVGSDAGSLAISTREGALLDGAILARGGSASNRGGAFNLVLGNVSNPLSFYDGLLPALPSERVLTLAQTQAPQVNSLLPGDAIPLGFNGQAKLSAAALEEAGFARISLKSRDAIRLEDNLNLGANRVVALKEVKLDSPRIETLGGNAALTAETLRLGNYDIEQQDVVNLPQAGSGTLTAHAQLLELAGKLTLTGMARAELNGAQEIRLSGISTPNTPRPIGALSTAADLVLHGALVAPSTYAQYTIHAPGRMVEFGRTTNSPAQPVSALGSLTVTAQDIVQGGNIWAPFGQLDFSATGTVTFKNGSLTSVAATPGSLIPFGRLVNGRDWIYQPNGATEIYQTDLAEKFIHTAAASIDMQAGAQINLAGSGDLQAYEFSVGPGGSRNILNDAGTYAILPGYTSGFAPGDSQANTGFDRKAGDAVYLAGNPGLPAGMYTLLPAHYALLPGAYAVRLSPGADNLLPGMAYDREDGIRVVAGYFTDSRAPSGGPRDALWSGFEVLMREQVLQRSEINLTRATDFFAASLNRPQDGGLLSLNTTGGLNLDAIFRLAAGSGGRGAKVDISAPKLAITSGTPSGIDPTATRIEADKLNALAAASLFLGGTRSTGGSSTTLTVGANEITLANDAAHALKGAEIILASKETLTLKAGSAIEAQGAAGDASSYTIAGNGALVRAASTAATLTRSGTDGTKGTLAGETGSTISAANSIMLEATRQNTFAGITTFVAGNGNTVAGNLALGATRMSFGAAPVGTAGLVFSQTELNGFNSLNSLILTSYSTFDLYGNVNVGGIDASGKPTLNNLSLLGAGLAGLDNSGMTANLRATEVVIANPGAAVFASGALGDGDLAIRADRLVLGAGSKEIQGFFIAGVTANELIGRGTGSTTIAAETNLNVARISGERGSDQTFDVTIGGLNTTKITADRALAAVNTPGAKWALSGMDRLLFDTSAALPSGQLKLTAFNGDLELGAHAGLDVAGAAMAFFDVRRAAPGGKIELNSDSANVVVRSGAKVNVSAVAGGDAGELIMRAVNGTVTAAAGTLQGTAAADAAGARGEGARIGLDVYTLPDFSVLNTALNLGEFDGARTLRVRSGDVTVAAADTVKAKDVQIAVDGGRLSVRGEINADGNQGGSIRLYSGGQFTLEAGAKLFARALQAGRDGGTVTLGSARVDAVLAGGSIDTAGLVGGQAGTVLIRADRFNDVAHTNLYAPLADTSTTSNSYIVGLSGVTGVAATLPIGLVVDFTPHANNAAGAGGSTLKVGGALAKPIWFNGALMTAANTIVAGQTAYMVYDGSRFDIVDAAFANRTASGTAAPVLATSTTTGTTTTNYVASQPAGFSYTIGKTLVFTPNADNIGTTNKLSITGLAGTKDIKYNNAITNLTAGFLKAGEPVYLVYDGAAFQVAREANAPRATGTANALTVVEPSAVSVGDSFAFVANFKNTTSATLTVNGVAGERALLKNGAALKSDDIKENDLVYATYDGTNFHVLTELAAKVDVGQGVRVTSVAGDYTQAIGTAISGASSIVVEAVRNYNALTRNEGGGVSGGVLDGNHLSADTYRYLPKTGRDGVKATLAGVTPTFDLNKFHLRPGTEIRHGGNIVLPRDLNLADYRYGGEPGVLTVLAGGNLLINNNLSDGFNVATPFVSGTTPATLLAGDSWSYRLAAGADTTAADPLGIFTDTLADVTLAAGKLVRTGTGDIRIASGHDIKLADNKSVIYSAGRLADAVSGFTVPPNAQFSQGGGSVSLTAVGNITGAASAQLYSNWLFRQGKLDAAGTAYTLQPAWWVRFDQFQQGIGALGGGDVTLTAGGNVQNVSASTPAQARMTAGTPDASALVKTGGGEMRVKAGADLLGGQYYADRGDLVITAGGKIDSGQSVSAKPLYTILALGDAQARVRAQGDVNIQTVLNPHLVVQSSGSGTSFNINNASSPLWSLFSTYSENSGAHLESLSNNVTLFNGGSGTASTGANTTLKLTSSGSKYAADLLSVLPPSLSATAFQGDIVLDGTAIRLSPAARADLTLLAAGSVSIPTVLTMSDMDPALIPDAVRPSSTKDTFFPNTTFGTTHAAALVHAGDTQPVRVYAVAGDVTGKSNKLNLTLPKALRVRAGQDVRDLGIMAQHVNTADVSRIEAGRDIAFTSGINRTDFAKIWLGGLGRLELTAGHDIDLGTSAGIVSRGDLDNPALSKGGVDIHLAAGVGPNGIDYSGMVDRLVAALESAGGSADDALLWQARWLTGNDALNGSNALTAVKAVQALDADTQRGRVREMVYSALLNTGRDHNDPASLYAAKYDRGYAAMELVFPGIAESNLDGSSRNYPGEINLFASRVRTERGGNIEFMVPGGDLIVGLSNTPANLVTITDNGVLGMVVVADGNIRGLAHGDNLVNQSRILTVGGGNVLLWSSAGDIDAGKGKKTATTVPPPVIKVDLQGNVTQELQGAASGSGIAALSSGGVAAGDIDLIAPKGAVNAGDAGIRANNLNIAASVVLGADNISVAGTTTGAPVADTSATSAVSSGATSQGDGLTNATAALAQSLADAAQNDGRGRGLRPTFISAEVIGRGN